MGTIKIIIQIAVLAAVVFFIAKTAFKIASDDFESKFSKNNKK